MRKGDLFVVRGGGACFEVVGYGSKGGNGGCWQVARKEKGERELMVLVDVVGLGFGEEIPCFEIIHTCGAVRTVFCDGLFGMDGGVEGHDEVCQAEFARRIGHIQS